MDIGHKQKKLIIFANDFILALICWLVFGPPMATVIASEFSSGVFEILLGEWQSFVIPALLAQTYLYIFGFYKTIIKFFDSKDSIFITSTGSLVFGFSWALMHVYQFQIVSTSFLSIAFLQGLLLAAVLYAFLNLSRDLAKYILYPRDTNIDARPVVIYGAGSSGNELFQSVLLDPTLKVVAFYDDSSQLKNRQINNIPILGSFKKLAHLKKEHKNLEVFLAIPSIDTKTRRAIISKLEDIKVAVRTVPSFHELMSDQKKMTDIQNLSLDDLLPRGRVETNTISNAENQNILISGAGGSIGSEIVRQVLGNNPLSIILLEVSEYNLYVIEKECIAIKKSKNLDTQIIPYLGDIRDKNHLNNFFQKYKINSVFHSAAYKHVPLVEDQNNIIKACENNILGTYYLALASINNNVDSFVMISTDKAVRPSNIMGASKRMAEMLIQSLDIKSLNTKFSMVRFGNVINSSGSVIPLFLDQISRGGPVTVTDKNVTRYFMTIPEAANLVLQASDMAQGGEVFILDMGEQLNIMDLAKRLVHLSGRSIATTNKEEGIEIIEVGLRPGEKMFEELLISGDQLKTKNPKIYKSMESFPSADQMKDLIDKVNIAIDQNDHLKLIQIFKDNVEGYIKDDL
jgi:FlaA1/EpsC-like NDP-sugar epimerase